jgi:hypothetical protein
LLGQQLIRQNEFRINTGDPNPDIWMTYITIESIKAITDKKSEPSSVINIGNIGGDAIGIGITGSDNIIGKSFTINQDSYNKLEPEFRDSLDDLLALIDKHGKALTNEQKESLAESIDGLTKVTKGLKADQIITDEEKKDEIKSKQITLAEKIVDYLPEVAETIASLTPLAPFSKVIGKGTGYFAEWIKRKLTKK